MTRANYEQIFKSHHPRARCAPAKGNGPGGKLTYFIHARGGEAGEMWSGHGDRPAQAWRDACERLGLTAIKETP